MALPAKGDPAEAIAAIVLAAGFSSRMGVFKPLLAFGERTVTGHVVAVLREHKADCKSPLRPVCISCGA